MLRARNACGRGGIITDAVLFIVFLTLLFVFIQRRGYINKLNKDVDIDKFDDLPAAANDGGMPVENKVVKSPDNSQMSIQIDERIRKIPDVRTMECKSHSFVEDQQCTIILTFFDYQFYDVKTTIASILYNTNLNLIKEIILVDDGSTLDYIREQSQEFAEKIGLMKLIRMSSKVGMAQARMRAVQESQTETLIFLDSTVIVTKGWLPPLTEVLRREPQTIPVPHFDSINNPISYEYGLTNWELYSTFSWSFTIRMSHDHVTNTQRFQPYVKTPTLRGTAYGIRKQLLNALGGLDETMNDPGAESLEFSLRAWMCGAQIKTLPCSRVGVLNLKDPVKIVIPENIRRIVYLWMPHEKEFIYKHTGLIKGMDSKEEESAKVRKMKIDQMQCKDFNWFRKQVIPDIYTPSLNAVAYGLLRCRSGLCSRIGDDKRLVLGECKPDQYKLHPTHMIFEQQKNGTITVNGDCLTVTQSAYIVAKPCLPRNETQLWEVKPNGVLKNVWSLYCGMHVTDPDKNVPAGRQIVMAQDCNDSTSGMFVEFEFILP